MIRLSVSMEPHRIDLRNLPHPVWMRVRPMSGPVAEAAKDRMFASMQELVQAREQMRAAGASLEGLPNLDDDHERNGLSRILYAQHLATVAILEWGGAGVEDPATGLVAPVTAATVQQLMLYPEAASSFIHEYTAPLDAVVTEGNGLGVASPGT